MKRFFTMLFDGKPDWTVGQSKRRGFKPALEALEDRLVPAGVTDMTALAQQMIAAPDSKTIVSTPDAPIHLYLNFDGYQDDRHTVIPYYGNFDQINDIVFRVSEIFSPFNVEVSRRDGFNNYDNANGSTTVFIGDDSHNNVPQPDGSLTNLIHGFTPGIYSDHPGAKLGDTHYLHSNPFNLAFVDPVGYDGQWSFQDTEGIAQTISHEAGHTFGLAHVLTVTGDNPAGNPEVMSYDSTEQYFADQTFDITNANRDSNTDRVVPVYEGTALKTQNSYTYLQQILGARPSDARIHIVHADSVDPAHSLIYDFNWSTNSVKTGTIDREGDYVVYQGHVDRDSLGYNVSIELTPSAGSDLRPTLLVYKDNDLLEYPAARINSAGQQEVVFGLRLEAGHDYSFVVFGANGTSTGGYRLYSQGRPVAIDLQYTYVIPGQDLASSLEPHLAPVVTVGTDTAGPVADPSLLANGLTMMPADGGSIVDVGVLAQADATSPPVIGDPLLDVGMLAQTDPASMVTALTDGGMAAQIDTGSSMVDPILTVDVGVGGQVQVPTDSSPTESVAAPVDLAAMPAAGDSSLAADLAAQVDPASSSTPAVVSQVSPVSLAMVQPAVNYAALNAFFSAPLLRTRWF